MIIYVGTTITPQINDSVRKFGATVWTNQDAELLGNAIALNGLAKVDAVVLDIASSSSDLHYILAQCIILQKPTLCLYDKKSVPREIVNHLTKPNVPKTIVVKSYSISNLATTIKQFISSVDEQFLVEEVPNIKFTLRLTQSLDAYLQWLATVKQINKAAYLRQLMKREMDQDSEYKKKDS